MATRRLHRADRRCHSPVGSVSPPGQPPKPVPPRLEAAQAVREEPKGPACSGPLSRVGQRKLAPYLLLRGQGV